MGTPVPKTRSELTIEKYLNGEVGTTDAMRKVTIAFMMLANAIGKVMGAQTVQSREVADQLSAIHDYMANLNSVVEKAGAGEAETENLHPVYNAGTKEEVEEYRKALLAYGKLSADPTQYDEVKSDGKDPETWTWKLSVSSCNTALKNMQLAVDNLSSESQTEQVALQTLMTYFNSDIDAASASIQKSGSQAQTVLRPLGG